MLRDRLHAVWVRAGTELQRDTFNQLTRSSYDLGFMGGLTTSPEFLTTFGNPNASLIGFLVSSYEVGATFGAAFTFILGDRFGRKPYVIGGALVVIVGAVIQTASYGVAQFLVGRLIAGVGLGFMTTVIPVWLAECAMPKNRGRMMAMYVTPIHGLGTIPNDVAGS